MFFVVYSLLGNWVLAAVLKFEVFKAKSFLFLTCKINFTEML
jgi:hypothetical protein